MNPIAAIKMQGGITKRQMWISFAPKYCRSIITDDKNLIQYLTDK